MLWDVILHNQLRTRGCLRIATVELEIVRALQELGYNVPNTYAIERRNGTARPMSKAQVRKTLAFAKRQEEKTALGWWTATVYNWSSEHRSLREELSMPQGKKVSTAYTCYGNWFS